MQSQEYNREKHSQPKEEPASTDADPYMQPSTTYPGSSVPTPDSYIRGYPNQETKLPAKRTKKKSEVNRQGKKKNQKRNQHQASLLLSDKVKKLISLLLV